MRRNPQTGESIQIKKSKTIGFRPAKSLKETGTTADSLIGQYRDVIAADYA